MGEIEKALNIKVIQEIPMDEKVSESIANKAPIVVFAPCNKVSIAYKKLAASIIGEHYEPPLICKIKNFLRI